MSERIPAISRNHPKDPAECWPVPFLFGRVLTALDSITVSIGVARGLPDPDAAAMLLGAAEISGANAVQMIRGGVPGNTYLVRATATRNTEVYVLAATLEVRTRGAR